MKKYLYLIILLSLHISSCVNKSIKGQEDIFTHEDFKETLSLKGKIIKIPVGLSPQEMFLMRDSFVLVVNNNPGYKYKIALYSYPDWQLINEFARIGHAKDEFIDCDVTLIGSGNNKFYITDVTRNFCSTCNTDSLVNGRNCIEKSFFYSREVIDFCPLDNNEYAGFNFWYLHNEKFDNGVQAMATYKMEKSIDKDKTKEKRYNKYKYFVANVTGGTVFENPKNHDVWVAYRNENRIEIYNKSMRLKKVLCGPVNTTPTLVAQKGQKMTEVLKSGKSYTSCFSRYIATDKHVFLIYENQNGVKYSSSPKPVEVLKFDWDGNPISNYKLDKFAYTLSIDSKEENLYATCCDSYTGEILFVKYKL